MKSCSFMKKNHNIYIYEIHFQEIICKLKEEEKTLRNLSHNFYNSNIHDAGKDIARVSS